ncbi:TPA: hypothetical protein ACSXXW_000936 [Pseudomonas aeruginosa]
MKRDFEAVGQYTEGDINNYGVQINLGDHPESRALVPAQRQELYDLNVKCVELGADSKEIWRRVFAELGIKQIGEITSQQFSKARDVLQARLDQLQEDDDKRRLIGKVLRAATEKDAKIELNNFCDINFGRTHLSGLKRADLQRVLEFIQGFEVAPIAPAAPTAAHQRLDFADFLITYRFNAAGLFLLGLIVGRFWL